MYSTFQDLKEAFPNKKNNGAITCPIPMDIFVQNEKDIRGVMRAEGLRAFFRGPRRAQLSVGRPQRFDCLRADAVAVVLYQR